MRKLALAVAALALSVPAAASAERQATKRYVVVDIGAAVGRTSSSYALGINAQGQVIGSVRSSGRRHGFVWNKGTATIIDPAAPESEVSDINDEGQVVGESFQPPDGSYAFVWNHGSLTKLGSLGGRVTSAVAINNRGQVIGNSTTATGASHAFIWDHGQLTDLGTLGGDPTVAGSDAVALNDRGQVVGLATTSRGAVHAFLWQSGRMRDLGTIDRLDARPVAINARGDVVGFANPPPGGDPTHAILWRNGRLIDLGRFRARTKWAVDADNHGRVLVQTAGPRHVFVWRGGRSVQVGPVGALASAINGRGQVVGRYPIPHRSASAPYIWQSGRLTRLPVLAGVGPPFGGVFALNDQGRAVGDSYTDVGARTFDHAVMWAPRR
jgi:probable HAF family extracellular repeat protein